MCYLTKIPLQIRIMILTTLGLSLALVAFAFLGLQAIADRGRQIYLERMTIARLIAWEMERALDHTQHMALAKLSGEKLSSYDQDKRLKAGTLRELHLLSAFPIYRILLLDRNGVAYLTEPEDQKLIGLDLSRLTPVKHSLESKEPVISGFIPWQIFGQPTVLFNIPLKDEKGIFQEMVVLALDLSDDGLADFLDIAVRGETEHVQVIDREGTVLASSDPDKVLRPWEHNGELPALFRKETFTVDFFPTIKEGRISGYDLVAFTPMSRAPWGIAVEQEKREAMDPVRRLQKRFLLLGLTVLTMALVVSWVTTRQVVRPIQALTAMTRS